jgi:hypothetical protein
LAADVKKDVKNVEQLLIALRCSRMKRMRLPVLYPILLKQWLVGEPGRKEKRGKDCDCDGTYYNPYFSVLVLAFV